jgi:hypothetical protein
MRSYVETDTARMIADYVRGRAGSGAYESITNPTLFGEAVTKDLRHVNGDLHLSLRYDPRGMLAAGGPMIVRGPGPGGPGPSFGGLGGGGARGPDGPMTPRMEEAVRKNFGLGRAEILPGNVGYLEITGFLAAPGFEEAIAAALRFLEHTDAIIFDVRRNGGGAGNMSDLLFSHFLPATPVPTVNVKSRIPEMNRQQTSLADVPGPRRPDVPLWVLTSRGTGSAAEAFSFVLQNLGRATIVGERTGGAGHMVQMLPLVDGFVAGLSITRVSDPRTGREWEGVGVQPDIAVAPEQALAVAHAAALRKLIAAADDPLRKQALAMTLEWVEARANPVTSDVARLAACVGAYEGEREIRLVDGHLEYVRAHRMGVALVPLGSGRFSADGESRLEFAAGKPSPTLTIQQADGTRTPYPRATGGL